jgi:hypothetical protein
VSADVELDHRDSVRIARVSGDVDITQASAVRKQLLSAVRNDDLGQRVLTIARLESVADVHRGLDEALAALRGGA